MGFARRVTSVASSGTKIVVKTSAPAIEDILQGDFQMVLDPAKGTDVDVTKLDLKWAADNLFFNTPDVDNMPGELLTDDLPPDVVPMGFFSKVTKSIKNGLAKPGSIAKSVQKAVVKAINAIIPDTISVAGSISPKIKINKQDDLFKWTGYKKTFTTKSGNNVELTIGGSGKYGAEVELQPGIQVGAKIGLPGQGASSQAWMNIDTRAQATVGADIALTATLSSVEGKLPGELEEYLNSQVDKGQEVYNTFREKLLGDPDTKPQATWKNTLWISKPKYQTFFAGEVPVVVVETIQVDLECGFEAKAGITAHAEWTQNATFKFTAKYDSATNSTTTTPPSFDKRHTYAVSVLGAGEAMFTCGLVPPVIVFLYDTIGVFAGLRESLVARASYQTECPKMPTNNWPTATVKLGLAANVGIQVGGRFQAPGSSFFGKTGQKAGFDVGPLEVWNQEFPLITKKYDFSRGLGFCYSSCLNGRLDGDETDVDCGDQCAPCAFGNKCAVNSDCADSSCINGSCSLGTCGNKVQDGVETDIDCGGPACPKCADTKSCELGPDCASGFCTGKDATTPGVCVTDHCTDAVKDADEGGIDCSGATCGKCAVGVAVTKAADCASGLWDGRACVATGIASIAPPTGVSTAPTMITITGAGFQAGAMVSVGSLPCANPVVTPPTMITCIAPAQAAVCGSFPVTVTNPDGTSATAANRFSYVEVPGGPPVFGTVTALPSGMWPDGVLAVDVNGNYGSTCISWGAATCRRSNHGHRNRSDRSDRSDRSEA